VDVTSFTTLTQQL